MSVVTVTCLRKLPEFTTLIVELMTPGCEASTASGMSFTVLFSKTEVEMSHLGGIAVASRGETAVGLPISGVGSATTAASSVISRGAVGTDVGGSTSGVRGVECGRMVTSGVISSTVVGGEVRD